MLYPSIDQLMEKADSKYALVVLAAKRARGLLEGTNELQLKPRSKKYVGAALEEIAIDLIVTPGKTKNA
ncbi:DNA-directed RNA polymerase subunit omega [Thermoactinomyces sp. DSM 45892]|uniref:DNA-directed RNA polymerase subunit omega n=1 Tax=Thermoactinomyces sp. DSM 45892 TaxID=1882753 RepID=UPI00089BC749|nr:DNA-directed RNA polymerase subunit omega [Thermoactinomyces sp. DSM 45892]SDY57923.1 DNA-directed RNA polymerase subunit omega [Thermoactinomyces sp. DSM 45892]